MIFWVHYDVVGLYQKIPASNKLDLRPANVSLAGNQDVSIKNQRVSTYRRKRRRMRRIEQ